MKYIYTLERYFWEKNIEGPISYPVQNYSSYRKALKVVLEIIEIKKANVSQREKINYFHNNEFQEHFTFDYKGTYVKNRVEKYIINKTEIQ